VGREAELEARLGQLEAKLHSVRLSRRVLINLLDSLERARREEVARLRAANRRLRHENRRYALRLRESYRRISHLEEMLRQAGPERPSPSA